MSFPELAQTLGEDMDKYLDTLTDEDVKALYLRDDGPDIVLEHVDHVLSEFSANPRTEEGRKAIKAMGRKLSSVKARCEWERKELTGGMRRELDAVYARSKRVSEGLIERRHAILQPVKNFEEYIAKAQREWEEAMAQPTEPGVADIAEVVEMDAPDPAQSLKVRQDILDDIVCLSAEQIVDKIMAGGVRHVKVLP